MFAQDSNQVICGPGTHTNKDIAIVCMCEYSASVGKFTNTVVVLHFYEVSKFYLFVRSTPTTVVL
jgi:hypothetical protein